ncbi:bifunctional aspartate kinase/homoserine dehydrogenase I [Buchnera aphidicola]|uniref:bifunctional aspartate kinase/homoserine dehydrogenase I n=1 Tax=Buchnera aphidicola TaxID=9 RepID=UPI002237C811|nr:bifunctional aspartate kinase/homoserine dehydrogenase I [Buchnera aphidicola]MCW5197728.1 bifunctional aspartate kinase/homoserine dehydrogenase I [Buchnera aphidicola (Chaitophorus viminalis)]
MINVLKFGGTSLADAKRIIFVSNIIEEKSKINKISVVLSAPATITNSLEKIIQLCLLKDKNYKKEIQNIKNKFDLIVKNIYKNNKNFLFKKIIKKINHEILFLKNTSKKIYLLNKCSKHIFAKVISRGEILSTQIMKQILLSKGHNITLINPVKKILAEGNILDAYVNINKSIKKIQKIKFKKNSIILMPGFIAGNKKKELVILGRNGSDYSAAILSACIKAQSCEIWTDVDGILTCDPKIFSNAKIIKKISYKNVTEISNLGAKVLHPKTIYPLKKFKIPCYIKNTFNKNFIGTKISNYSNKKIQNIYPNIAYIKNVTIFIIKTLNQRNINKIYKNLLKINKKESIILFFSINFIHRQSINIYVNNIHFEKVNFIIKKLIFNKKETYKKKIYKKISIISIIKPKLYQNKKIIQNIYQILYDLNIKTMYDIKNFSKNSISLIIKSKYKNKIINLLHKKIINNYKIIQIFLFGIGGIGQTLLKQINQEKKSLKKKNIIIKICLISNSNKILFQEKGIKINSWKEKFHTIKKKYFQEKFLINKIKKIIKKNNFINPSIVDCTSSKKISKEYLYFIKNKFNIITANKKFNTGNITDYKNIRKKININNKKFFYETNVGGGLPVIQTIQNLKQTGDKLINFKGILSGSLSFIFGKLEQKILFSDAIKQAKEKGLTEPDPREDLSGLDVARKLLIIAREFGYSLELKDIQIKKILPQLCNSNSTVQKFLKETKKFNKYFLNKIKSAKKNNKKIKFIAKISNKGKCTVQIEEVDKKDPLYEIKNGENALSFYTKYYQPIPLVIRGYGAGKKVTASGVLSDLLKTIV